MAEACVDASFAIKIALPEQKSELVREKWALWAREDVTIIAPWLWLFETHSVLRRKVARRELTEPEAREGWRILRRQSVRTVHPRGMFDRAWMLAVELDRPTTYDAVYLAAAELHHCELWTADERLANSARKLKWVQLV